MFATFSEFFFLKNRFLSDYVVAGCSKYIFGNFRNFLKNSEKNKIAPNVKKSRFQGAEKAKNRSWPQKIDSFKVKITIFAIISETPQVVLKRLRAELTLVWCFFFRGSIGVTISRTLKKSIFWVMDDFWPSQPLENVIFWHGGTILNVHYECPGWNLKKNLPNFFKNF